MNLENLVHLLAQTHQSLHQRANRAVDFALVVRNWLFGYYIVEFEQQGEDRAQYGQRLLDGISRQLRAVGILGCSVSNLKNFRRLYEAYPQIRQTLSGELISAAASTPSQYQFYLPSKEELRQKLEDANLPLADNGHGG